MKPLTYPQFDALELITIMGGSVTISDYATRLDVTDEAAHSRLRRLERAGLLMVTRDASSETNRRLVYSLSRDGLAAFQERLASMDPASEPVPVRIPAPSRLIEIPALIAARVITMEVAA